MKKKSLYLKGAVRMGALALTGFLLSAAQAAPHFFVAPNGNDAWSGQRKQPNAAGTDGPLASLQGARDAVRRAGVRSGAEVNFAPGTYFQTAPVEFGAQDSGAEDAPIHYRARGLVRLTGGKSISGFAPVQDAAVLAQLPPQAAGKVLQCDLAAQGIMDYGNLSPRGFAMPLKPAGLELFFDDKPMTLARWPNATAATPSTQVGTTPMGKNGMVVGVEDEARPRLAKWATEKEPWGEGCWGMDWADEHVLLAKIDAAQGTLTLGGAPQQFGIIAGQKFYVQNMLCELDEPGEWYLDRERGQLYFWPPSEIATGRANVSMASTLIKVKSAQHIWFDGFTLESTRADAVDIADSDSIWLSSCVVRNTGMRGVDIAGGQKCQVSGSDIYDTSDGGIHVTGGDRATLTGCGHVLDNNHIYRYNRWDKTYRAAIDLTGVGITASHNLIHDSEHMALGFRGNDNLIEFNEIYNVVTDTGDAGAIYTGRDWTSRGNILRYNYFHDIHGTGHLSVMGIYLDDQASGAKVEGNVFYNVDRGAFIGGGDENLVLNNIFVKCQVGVHLDARGLGWQKAATDDPNGTLRQRLKEMPYQSALWKQHYPFMASQVEGNAGQPQDNQVKNNIGIGCAKWPDFDAATLSLQQVADNAASPDISLVARLGEHPRSTDFAFIGHLPLAPKGFAPIPLERIGLREKVELPGRERRASWPVAR